MVSLQLFGNAESKDFHRLIMVINDIDAPGAFIRFAQLDTAVGRPLGRFQDELFFRHQLIPAVPAVKDKGFLGNLGKLGIAENFTDLDGKCDSRVDRLQILHGFTNHGFFNIYHPISGFLSKGSRVNGHIRDNQKDDKNYPAGKWRIAKQAIFFFQTSFSRVNI